MLKKQEEALLEICRYRFAALETALYLDTHPNDAQVLQRHNYYSTNLRSLIDDYNKTYNDPLTIYDTADDYWTYIDRWPFGCGCGNCGGEN